MEVFLEKENKNFTIKIKEKRTLKSILKELNISIDSIILIKNNEITLEDEFVEDCDNIKILSVVSGG